MSDRLATQKQIAKMGSFYSAWETWEVGNPRRGALIERYLEEAYRGAWESGDDEDRYAVLEFILDRREPDGFDLILEGLRSDDVRLASNAGAIACALISEGFDIGPTTRPTLEDFRERLPEWDALGIAALELLDSMEQPDREFVSAIAALAAEKNMPLEIALATAERTLAAAYKRDHLAQSNVVARINRQSGIIGVHAAMTVVENVEDEMTQIALAEARRIRPDFAAGETLLVPVTPSPGGRDAAKVAKATVLQLLQTMPGQAVERN